MQSKTPVLPVSAARILAKAGAPALLVGHLPNIRYCTGLDLSAGFLLVQKRGFTLYVDARYSENAAKMLGKRVLIRSPKELPGDLKALPRVAIEADHVTLTQFGNWKKKIKSTKFVHSCGVIEEFRRQKLPAELAAIRAACAISLSVLRRVPKWLKPGMTERELAWKIAEACNKAGASGMAFETIVGFGAHTSRPHHRPTAARLRKGDVVQVDMGAVVNGYCSDYSRVYFTAEPTAEQRRAYRVLSSVVRAVTRKVRAGVTNVSLDAEARRLLGKHGYTQGDFPHALGHGVGLDIHEGVVLSSRAPKAKLKKNEVVTVEPGLYFPGRWGMRIEDTVIVA